MQFFSTGLVLACLFTSVYLLGVVAVRIVIVIVIVHHRHTRIFFIKTAPQSHPLSLSLSTSYLSISNSLAFRKKKGATYIHISSTTTTKQKKKRLMHRHGSIAAYRRRRPHQPPPPLLL